MANLERGLRMNTPAVPKEVPQRRERKLIPDVIPLPESPVREPAVPAPQTPKGPIKEPERVPAKVS
jgi:hypothetical protein